jgi:hypothetical protein
VYGRKYIVTIVSARISQRDQAGEYWDAGSGAPDPYVCAMMGLFSYCTATVQDVYQAYYNESFQATINSTDSWTFAAVDEDLIANDTIENFVFNPIPALALKNGSAIWSGDYLESLVVKFERVP